MNKLTIDPGRVALLQQRPRSDSIEGAPLNAPRQAPVRLTPMRRLTEVADHVAQTETDNGGDNTWIARNAKDAVKTIRSNQGKAREVGVDTTRKSFWCKALGIGVAVLAFAAAVSVAVATGGAAAVAAAVITGVVCLISVADARCAYMNHQNAKAHAEGRPPPYDLPMGDSSVGNLLHKLFSAAGFGPQWTKTLATICDRTLRVAMAAATALCTMGVTAAVNSFEHVAPLVGSAINLAQTLGSVGHDWSSASRYVQTKEAIKKGFAALRESVNQSEDMDHEDRANLLADIDGGEKACYDDVEKGKSHIPSKLVSVATTGFTLGVGGTALAAVALSTLAPGTASDAVDARMFFGAPGYAVSASTGLQGLRQPPEERV